MRVALLGAFLDDADFLILDEPSNPLDGPARALLRARLAAWDGGLLLVSHDRELLEGMQRIVELSTLGLRSYGGGYSFYAQLREEAREAAERRLDRHRLERKRQTLAMREQQQRQERRQASGRREGKTANQAKILLGGFRNVARSAPASCATPTRRSASVSTARCARLPGRSRRRRCCSIRPMPNWRHSAGSSS